ncbi:Unknown protein [Striga hermonthica]|uniref:Peptidase A1 domain-containing protein n=1 Tax=Striga hermonthica TaxID=68872 RepID=A0A9N7R1L7_STRHE|nr:Unknown protein [Striga hermonthica]
MVFGCSHKTHVFFGILGMDKRPVSLISQMREKVKERYSYCLHKGHGMLRFGDDIPQVTKDYKTTKLLNPLHPSVYVGLTDISVVGKRLGLSAGTISNRSECLLIDTGVQFTILQSYTYDKVIKAFKGYYGDRLKQVKMPGWGLCYRHNSSMRSNASMTFHLEGGDYMTNDMFVDPIIGIMCLALVSNNYVDTRSHASSQ